MSFKHLNLRPSHPGAFSMPISDGYPLLDTIESPSDLRGLPEVFLPQVADELRRWVIESVSETGGHFAAGLGVIELTVALHYAFNTPHDRLVWDVGHQTYPHKVLTGRRARMSSIRKRHGLSGFPRRDESPYDTFGVAHAGTSISAALGMLLGARLTHTPRHVIPVIGDGALTAGMALEALNHAGDLKANLLVILNDNGMSISPNVGALSRHLGKLSGRTPALDDERILSMNGQAQQAAMFREFGYRYYGPIDGHDLPALMEALREMQSLDGPRLLHVVTQKGKGYPQAEQDPITYHGVKRFDHREGIKPAKSHRKPPTYTQVFGHWLCDMADRDSRLVAITPAMREGSGLVEFEKCFPARYFDAGIAEQHATTLAAGFACEGAKPVLAIYSTFLQRGYDQFIHDVALQNLDVLLAIDRAGLVGPDGPTHAGVFDLSYLRCVPNLVVMAPADENEARHMLYTGFMHEGPAAVRYPRASGLGLPLEEDMRLLPVGKATTRCQGRSVAILAFGTLLTEALQAGSELEATVINMRFICPLDENTIVKAAETHDLIVTIEDNMVAGGAGSGVNEILAARGLLIPVINMGLPAHFIGHGERNELLAECGLDAAGIMKAVHGHFRKRIQITYNTGTKS